MKTTVPEGHDPHETWSGLRTPFSETGSEPATLTDLLDMRATEQPEAEALTFLEDGETQDDSLTYRELNRRARSIASRLQAMGIEPGERALLLYPPGLEYVAGFLGCLHAGVVAVPAYPPRPGRPEPRLRAIATDSGASLALTTAHVSSDLGRRLEHAPELESLRWLATDDGRESGKGWNHPEVAADTLAFLQYTSGTTAAPKGVMVTHGNLLHNLAMIYHAVGHTPESQMVSWLPPYHDMGLIEGILQPLYGGFPAALMPPVSFLQRPLSWLRTISRLGADTAGAPNFAYDLCARKITSEELSLIHI